MWRSGRLSEMSVRFFVLTVPLWALLQAIGVPLAFAGVPVTHQGSAWLLQNDILCLSVDQETGLVEILDKETGVRYRQPLSCRDPLTCEEADLVLVKRSKTPVKLDGDPSDWEGVPLLSIQGEGEFFARVGFQWDDQYLYVLFLVEDDCFEPRRDDASTWWEGDSVEWWVGWDQAGFRLDPEAPGGFLWGGWKDWAKAACRPREEGSYVAETAAELKRFIAMKPVQEGRRFRVAFAVNDADKPNERSERMVFPDRFEQGRIGTYAVAVLGGEGDEIPPRLPEASPILEVKALGDDGLCVVEEAQRPEGAVGRVQNVYRLEPGSRDLRVESQVVDCWTWDAPFYAGFLPVEGEAEYILPYYGNGVLIETDDLFPPCDWLGVFDQLDMPAVGVACEKGGLLCLFRTYDFMAAQMRGMPTDKGPRLGLLIQGKKSKGTFLPSYETIWHVSRERGHVPLAKRLRQFCQSQGWVVPLSEKARLNENVRKLFGAAHVWGSTGFPFAREARAAAVSRALVNGSFSADQVAGIVDLGFLSGEYDQYVDVDEHTEWVDGKDPLKEDIRIHSNGKPAKGWTSLDGKHQWYSRCSETAHRAAEQEIPRVLAEKPFNARFFDVHTAMGLVECYSEIHPCTRTEDRENKEALLGWARSGKQEKRALVLGGEHGRAWSVPYLDYQEGMMSHNPFFGWKAGHLVPVESEEELGEDYLEYGISYRRRVPWFELVFHDCVVSTWYWGDTIGYLHRVLPDLTDRKIALTALYGTTPMMWATPLGLGFEGEGKEKFLDAYRRTCKIHEQVAGQEMLSHRFLSEDRALQETVFANHTTVRINFASEARAINLGGESYLVPPNGILAQGPQLLQVEAVKEDGIETLVERPGYRFLCMEGSLRERGGLRTRGPLTVERLEEGCLRIVLQPSTQTAAICPASLDETWDPRGARLLVLDEELEAASELPLPQENGWISLPAAGEWACLELLFGQAVRTADLGFEDEPHWKKEPVQGQPFPVAISLLNRGLLSQKAHVRVYWDRVEEDRLAGEGEVRLEGQAKKELKLRLETARVAGEHEIVWIVEGNPDEPLKRDNVKRLSVAVKPDLASYAVRLPLVLEMKAFESEHPAVSCRMRTLPSLDKDIVDPGSVIVARARGDKPGEILSSQWNAAGELVVLLSGSFTRQEVPCVVLAREKTQRLPSMLPALGCGWDEEKEIFKGTTYEAHLDQGALKPVLFRDEEGNTHPCMKRLIFSSPETGWSEKGGKVLSAEVLEEGPVRTVVGTVKQFDDGQVVTRTYFFYDGYFVVEASSTQLQTGLYSRIWYAQDGLYKDDAGRERTVDGEGRDEGITKDYEDPEWFSYERDGFAHICLALSPMKGQSYWDQGKALGQCGFQSECNQGNRIAHVFGRTGERGVQALAEAWKERLSLSPVGSARRDR